MPGIASLFLFNQETGCGICVRTEKRFGAEEGPMRDKKPARPCGRMQSFERAKSGTGPDQLLKFFRGNG